MSFAFTLFFVALIFGTLYAQAWRTKNRLSAITWEQLVRQIEEVPTSDIARVALDYLQPARRQFAVETNEMWRLVGGVEGLKRMKANAQILIQLAALAEQWNHEESVIVAERMRREGLMLRRAIGKLQRGLIFGNRSATAPICVQEAATAYYLMRQRILALYKSSHVGHYGRLSIALGNPMAAYGPAL